MPNLEPLETIVAEMEGHIATIKSEIETSKAKGFVYARSKNIRKAAQELKAAAQNLRVATSDEINKKKSSAE